MEFTNLGASGLKVSRLTLGCMGFGDPQWKIGKWVQGEEHSFTIIKRAVELGFNFFDTADSYSDGRSEEILGSSIKGLGLARDSVVIATKVFYPIGKGQNDTGLSRKHIMQQIETSLKNLQTDYVDL